MSTHHLLIMANTMHTVFLFFYILIVNTFIVNGQPSNGDILALLLRLENKVLTLESQLNVLTQKCGSCAGIGSSGTPTLSTGIGQGGIGPGGIGSGGTPPITGSGPGTAIGGSGCIYKNVVYTEGQTWQDGCDYRCTCKNGNTGYYTCTQVCLIWTLPSQCRLDPPAPGKCCKVPNCPANVQLNYPPGFTAA